MKKHYFQEFLHSTRGEFTYQSALGFLAFMIAIIIFLNIASGMITLFKLNDFTNELKRTAEISGRIGTETQEREKQLSQETGLSPKIEWSKSGNIQLNDKFTVTCSTTQDIGIHGIGSFPITLPAKASGRSEVYWK